MSIIKILFICSCLVLPMYVCTNDIHAF